MELKRCYADNVKIKMNLLVDRIMRRIFVFPKAMPIKFQANNEIQKLKHLNSLNEEL